MSSNYPLDPFHIESVPVFYFECLCCEVVNQMRLLYRQLVINNMTEKSRSLVNGFNSPSNFILSKELRFLLFSF